MFRDAIEGSRLLNCRLPENLGLRFEVFLW